MAEPNTYEQARAVCASVGVDTDAALKRLEAVSISLPCWQGDDVRGFLDPAEGIGGGLAVTGGAPGRARNAVELRQDLEQALALIPGKHKVSLHAIYAETDGRVGRDELTAGHFKAWLDWAATRGVGLDFNPTCFSHPLAADGFTLSSPDKNVRKFWIKHCVAARRIGEAFGRKLGKKCVTNLWIPDGYKDTPVDRLAPRERLRDALDEIYSQPIDAECNFDTLESKLFGIGTESYVVGSHEFYLGYALKHNLSVCLDTGHFHPTESIADKISSLALFNPEFLLHLSRPVRWDSDHVATLDDGLQEIAFEIVRHGLLDRIHLGLDYFDASINRVAAWVIGARSVLKSLLRALLEPVDLLCRYEQAGDYTSRLALLEELKTFPLGAVWDRACETAGVPVREAWLPEIKKYEHDILSGRT